MYFPVQFSVWSAQKIFGVPLLLQGAQKAVGGAKKVLYLLKGGRFATVLKYHYVSREVLLNICNEFIIFKICHFTAYTSGVM